VRKEGDDLQHPHYKLLEVADFAIFVCHVTAVFAEQV
jgi:hypothetical protein